MKDNKMLAAVLVIIIVLAVVFVVWKVVGGKQKVAVDEKGRDLLAPLELKPGQAVPAPPDPNQPATGGG